MTTLMMHKPMTFEQVRQVVRETDHCVMPCGAGTKKPLTAGVQGMAKLDMTGLRGITAYDPQEFTFTANAGTPISQIEAALSEHRQYLPFDPPLGDAGATLGGTVAAGLSGSGRLRYGGIRDFIIGVRLVDGTGKLIRGGGKVVKNAAGFDLPKLMVGSMGRLGVIVEMTFKVFPAPAAWRSIRVYCHDLNDAVERMQFLAIKPLELEAMDLEPPATLVVRVGGNAASLPRHAARVAELTRRETQMLEGEHERAYWHGQRHFHWVAEDQWLIKVALTAPQIANLDRSLAKPLAKPAVARRYAVAGNLAWVAWPRERPLEELDLKGLSGVIVRGPVHADQVLRVGEQHEAAKPFAQAIKTALDPQGRLPPLL